MIKVSKTFYKIHVIKHIFISLDHFISNGPVVRFVDSFKQALTEARNDVENDEAVRKLSKVWRVTFNVNTS